MKNNTDTEISTLGYMVDIYCKGNHHSKDGICDECAALLEYAKKKTGNCTFKENKPACKDCTIHCYNEVNRKKIREIMKYSGPRMMSRHPVLAIAHLLKSTRKPALKK